MRKTAVRPVPFPETSDDYLHFWCAIVQSQCRVDAQAWYDAAMTELDNWYIEEIDRINEEEESCLEYAEYMGYEEMAERCRLDALREALVATTGYNAKSLAYSLVYKGWLATCELVYRACCLFDPNCFFPGPGVD